METYNEAPYTHHQLQPLPTFFHSRFHCVLSHIISFYSFLLEYFKANPPVLSISLIDISVFSQHPFTSSIPTTGQLLYSYSAAYE